MSNIKNKIRVISDSPAWLKIIMRVELMTFLNIFQFLFVNYTILCQVNAALTLLHENFNP
jgi:hypothetical protein